MNFSVRSFRSFGVQLRRGHLRTVGTQIIIVAVAFLVAALLLLSVNVTKLQESFAWVQNTDDELILIAQVEARLERSELTVRGYALTNDAVFLGYHQNEARQMSIVLDKLGKALADDPVPVKAAFARTRSLVQQRMDQFAQLLALGPGHMPDVANAILDARYHTLMRATRAGLERMQILETQELAERQASAAEQARRTYAMAIGIVVLAFAFGALGLAFVQFGADRS